MRKFIYWLFSSHVERERRKRNHRSEIMLHDAILFAAFFAVSIILCIGLSRIYDDNNHFAVPIFILVVAMVARFTQGYLFGVLSSVLGVFCVNYMFTFPYWEFDLTIAGYPLTFAAMLMVSICISALTTRIKRQDQLRLEAEMEKMRANLLRSVSHDLRTPLTSIIGSSSVLLEDKSIAPSEHDELLLEINKDARWLARITENILSVTKFSDEKVNLHKEYEVLEEIVSSAIVKFRATHETLQISVQKPEEILLAPMDGTLIEQVLLNLLDNAVVHGENATSIIIRIAADGDSVTIAVSDNGSGINQQVFPHLFDGFASAFTEKNVERRNMGIGLSVCQSIVKAHGGEISARNMPNGGACFEIRLPAGKEGDYE